MVAAARLGAAVVCFPVHLLGSNYSYADRNEICEFSLILKDCKAIIKFTTWILKKFFITLNNSDKIFHLSSLSERKAFSV